MNPHPLDRALRMELASDGRVHGQTDPGYANMVGPYGGIMAAQALQAVMLQPQRLGEPVALTVNFVAPMADGPFEVQARAARTNRSTQHWIVEIIQSGETVTTATVFTALRRETWADVEHRMPQVPPPEAVPLLGIKPRVPWLGNYEMRPILGPAPTQWDGAQHADSRSLLWMRDRPARVLDAVALTALADLFFPRFWRRQARFVPVGTVSMTVYFLADSQALAAVGSGYLLGQAQAQSFSSGYFDQTAQLWSESGNLLATSHQVVYFKP